MEHESCQPKDMEVNTGEGMEELSFIPSAVTGSAGWRELLRTKYMCDKTCNTEGFSFFHIAAILVEDDGWPHTMNLCKNCHTPEAGRKKRMGGNQFQMAGP